MTRATHCICMLALAAAMLGPGEVRAQGKVCLNPGIEERKEPSGTMGEIAYKRLSSIHELMGEDRYGEALAELEKMGRLSLNNYEKALMWQTYGFVYSAQGKFGQAIEYFERSLAQDALTTAAQQGMLYSLAGLYQSEGRYQEAIDTMRTWFRYEPEPQAGAYMIVGASFAELKRYREALPCVQLAIEAADKPTESWFQLELAIHMELEDLDSAAGVLTRMVQFWPDKTRYWETLSGVYLELKKDQMALATSMAAYNRGLIADDQKILNLVRLNLYLDNPYVGGRILATALEQGQVEATKKNLDLLLSAWTSAREYDRAISAIDQLGRLTGDAKYYMDKAGILTEQARWDEAATAARQALDAGTDATSRAWMLIGMAYTELDRLQEALDAFGNARDTGDAKERQNASAWIAFVRDRQAVERARVSRAAG